MSSNRDKFALLIGLFLIIIVAIITFYRAENNEEFVLQEEIIEEINNFSEISAKDLQKKIRTEENVKILDIRNRSEYEYDHIADSINVPLSDIEKSSVTIESENTIVVVGNSGDNYNAVVETLENNGHQNILVLSGGFNQWKISMNQSISFGNPDSIIDQSKVEYIVAEDLKNLIDTNYPAFILDVRQNKSFTEGHIIGAKNIPLSSLEEKRNEIPIDADIVVYGANEVESFQAGVRLYDLNFFSVSVFKEGLELWKEKGFEVVK
ncbi:rhodanese-like domain-containing protein [Patescibacteria group bacterium]